MKSGTPLVLIGLVLSACVGLVLAGDDGQPIVNLGRLSIARVYASSVNGGRSMANKYYGVRNLFDGGTHIINNINYTYWLTDSSSRHWVRVRFVDALVEVHSVVVETSGRRPPTEYALQLSCLDGGQPRTRDFDSIRIGGFRTTYSLPEPVRDVQEVMLIFCGEDTPSIAQVSEVEIMGRAPAGLDLTPVGPYIDVDETEVRRVSARVVEEYLKRKYSVGKVTRTEDGWAYTVTARGREILKVSLDDKGTPLELVDLESDIREGVQTTLNTR